VQQELLRRLESPGHTYTELQRFFSRCTGAGFGGASGHSAKTIGAVRHFGDLSVRQV